MFDPAYKPFNQVATSVLLSQQASRDGATGPRGDHRGTDMVTDVLDASVTVIAFVGNQIAGLVISQQSRGLGHIGRLTGCGDQLHRPAGGLNGDVQFGAEAAARIFSISTSTPRLST